MISVIHNIINEYKDERGYYTIMPTKKELQEENQMIRKDSIYIYQRITKENEELKKKIRKLKCDIYEVIGHENYERGYGEADLATLFPTQN